MAELVLIAAATFVSEDLTCISAGVLAANQSITLLQAIIACYLGIFTGDIGLVFLGKLIRTSAFARRIVARFVSEQRLMDTRHWLDERGARAIIASRFIPGTRLPLYLAVGYAGSRLTKFLAAFAFACLLWTPLIVTTAYFLGEESRAIVGAYQHTLLWLVFLVAAIYLLLKKFIMPLFTWRGRRLLLSSWLRARHWEFWPTWIFYFPMGFYIASLILRHRSATLFTAANPAIPDGGVIGESKAAILTALTGAGRAVARFALILPGATEDRLAAIKKFLRSNRLKYPAVLKPDVGERGNGVQIIQSENEVHEYLLRNPHAVIAQEYIAGLEFGVFYYRFPNSSTGEILAITDKRFPELVGDGERTLEELILGDRRAVMMARYHLRKYSDQIHDVVPRGETFKLVELGTHCKGSLFLDGTGLATPQLARQIDAISRKFSGFYFGRYDIRVPSLADFQRGKNMKIVELNGVTSEATSIYDPANTLWNAYRILARQWRIAFAIGSQNVQLGAKVTGVFRLVENILSAI